MEKVANLADDICFVISRVFVILSLSVTGLVPFQINYRIALSWMWRFESSNGIAER